MDIRVSLANTAKDKAEKNKDTDAASVARAESKAAEQRADNLNEVLVDQQKKLQGAYFVLILLVLVLSLLYTVGLSSRTGQTLGKKRQRIRLARLDGSPPGFGPTLIHYGLPLGVALLLFGVLGPLALLIGLGMVLWNLRDRNRQGVHDKLAKTLVVSDTD